MFNKVVLVGNLTRDIEMRYSKNNAPGTSGLAIGSSAIAVTRKFSVNGDRREEVCFVDITFYGRGAEIANQYLSKGSKVLIEGRLKFDQWTDQNGQNRSKHSIAVENMEMLGSKNDNPNNNFANQNAGFAGATMGSLSMGGNFANASHYSSESSNFNAYEHTKKAHEPSQNQEKLKEIDVDTYNGDDSDLPF